MDKLSELLQATEATGFDKGKAEGLSLSTTALAEAEARGYARGVEETTAKHETEMRAVATRCLNDGLRQGIQSGYARGVENAAQVLAARFGWIDACGGVVAVRALLKPKGQGMMRASNEYGECPQCGVWTENISACLSCRRIADAEARGYARALEGAASELRHYSVIKARIGDVVIKRVGDKWHVYALGPLVIVESLTEAIDTAKRMPASGPKDVA